MTRSPDLPCARCGHMMWRTKNSKPAGEAMCHGCRSDVRAEAKRALWSPIESACMACGETFLRTVMQSRKVYCDPCGLARRQAQWRDSWYRRHDVVVGGELVTGLDVTLDWGWTCHLCGLAISKILEWPHSMSLSLDHVIPLSRGGLHVRENMRPAHLSCNISKGAKMSEEIS